MLHHNLVLISVLEAVSARIQAENVFVSTASLEPIVHDVSVPLALHGLILRLG